MSLLNKAVCRRFILETADARWHGTYGTRVGADVFDHLEAVVQTEVRRIVRSHPSAGKTVSMGTKKRSASCCSPPSS